MAGPFGGRGSRGRAANRSGKLFPFGPVGVSHVRTIRRGDREAIRA